MADTPHRIKTARRRRQLPWVVAAAIEPLIQKGFTWQQIATHLGYASRKSVESSYRRAAARLGRAPLHIRPQAGTRLTAQQVKVLQLLADGLWLPEIGKRLGIATSTVKRHTTMLYACMGARNAHHAVALAYQRGLLKPAEEATR